MFQNYSFHFNSTKIFIIFSNFFVSRHHINTSIFFSPLHPTATTIDTSSPPALLLTTTTTSSQGTLLCTRREKEREAGAPLNT